MPLTKGLLDATRRQDKGHAQNTQKSGWELLRQVRKSLLEEEGLSPSLGRVRQWAWGAFQVEGRGQRLKEEGTGYG